MSKIMEYPHYSMSLPITMYNTCTNAVAHTKSDYVCIYVCIYVCVSPSETVYYDMEGARH